MDVHNTSEVLPPCANTDPQRDSIFTKGPSDAFDHATSEIASGSKLGIDATKKLPGEGFKRPAAAASRWDAAVKARVENFQPVALKSSEQSHANLSPNPDLSAVLEGQRQAMLREVQDEQPNKLLNVNVNRTTRDTSPTNIVH